MQIRITPHPLDGCIEAVASKSCAHRLLIAAALSERATSIAINESSADIEATIRCLAALGAGIVREGGLYTVSPINSVACSPRLDCGESGSTLRFLLPVAAALGSSPRFTGSGRLPERPLSELLDAMSEHGVTFSSPHLPLTLCGALTDGEYLLPGNVSSQYISGLLMALPLLAGDSSIRLATPLESAGYVEMTVAVLNMFGINIEKTSDGFFIPGGQRFCSPGSVATEGDWSNAAFFLAAGALSGQVTVRGLKLDSPQGDRQIVGLLQQFGAEVGLDGGRVTVRQAPLRAIRADMANIPDLLPIAAVLAACAKGETLLYNAARLRIKESDRLAGAARLINRLGGQAQELPDGLLIHGGALRGGQVESFNDHRIAMSAAIAALACKDAVLLSGAEAVNKSYPKFFTHFSQLGGVTHVV